MKNEEIKKSGKKPIQWRRPKGRADSSSRPTEWPAAIGESDEEMKKFANEKIPNSGSIRRVALIQAADLNRPSAWRIG